MDRQAEVVPRPATSCSCVVVALLCECPLSSGREFVAGAMTISIEIGITKDQSSSPLGSSYLDAHHMKFLNWYSYCHYSGSKGVSAMDGMAFSAYSDQEHFQGGRDVITFIVVDDFTQGSVDHRYYLDFDQDPANNDHFLDHSFDHVSVGDFDQVQEYRAQWDPGRRRLEVKPGFKEGEC